MRKFIILFAVICILTPALSSAQIVQEAWVARYNGTGNNTDKANAIAIDDYGNVYVTGESKGNGVYLDYATIKYDASGNQLWVARYNGPGDRDDRAVAIAVDGAGNVYVTGESKGSGSSYDFATIKYDTSGNRLWIARYDGSGNSDDRAHGIALDGYGNVYVTGESKGNGTSLDYATIKYSASGSQTWVKRYNGLANYHDAAYAITIDSNGNVYITGESKGSGTCLDYLTIKYNASGTELWTKRSNSPANYDDSAYAIALDSSGNIYVTGKSRASTTQFDYLTIKYDSNGNEQWSQRYNGTGNRDDIANGIAVDNGGNAYVTGESEGNGSSEDYATIKYTTNGSLVWVSRYNGPESKKDKAHAIVLDSSGNIYVTGESEGNGSSEDYATIKYDTNGNELWVVRYDGPVHSDDGAYAMAVVTNDNLCVTGESTGQGSYGDYATVCYAESTAGISAVPSSHNFGSINIGSSSGAQTFTVTNTGTANLIIGTITLTGTDPTQFGKQNDNCSGQTVAPSGNCTVQALFSPTSAGTLNANLSIPSNAPSSPTLVLLSGTGVGVAGISANPSSHNFGSINIGSSSGAQTFTVTNTGTANLIIGTITLTGTDPTQFGKQNDNCSGQTVAPSGNCTVQALFSPTSAGTLNANLSIPSNAPGTPTLVALSGTGATVLVSHIRIPVAEIDFGIVNVGSSLDRTTMIYNDGIAPLTVNSIMRLSGSMEFTYIGPTTPFNVPAGGSQAITLRYSPVAGSSAIFDISSNDPANPNVTFNVSGTESDVCTIYVPLDYPTIQDAINAAYDGCTILVSSGTYVENINFQGKAIRVKGAGGSGPCGCQQEGNAKVSIYGAYNGSVVTFNTGETRNSILESFTIEYGYATEGGGIFIDNASPTIKDCFINKNSAYEANGIGYGGGIYISGTNALPLIFNNLITENAAKTMTVLSKGGGIYVGAGASPTIQNCTISDNESNSAGGGGIYISNDSSPYIIDSIIWNNMPGDLICETGCGMNVTYSDVGEAVAGIGNISSEPFFTGGSVGLYYLSHTRAGQSTDSPCIDSGSTLALNAGLDASTTANDGIPDRGIVDMGYHYIPTPVSIQKAWTEPGDTFYPGQTITFNITYRVEGNPESMYEVTLKLLYQRGNNASTRRSFMKIETRAPGLYTTQLQKTVPSSVAPGEFLIGYLAIVKQVGGTGVLGRDIWISSVVIR